MEVDNERVDDEDARDEVQNVLRSCKDNDENNATLASVYNFDMVDNDDEIYDPTNHDPEDYF
jgi:hypothetical protein